MMPVVFINCKRYPFVDMIMDGRKIVETRTANTLKALVGQRIMIAETGKGKPVVRCAATIAHVYKCSSREDWYRSWGFYTGIEPGSDYDWNDNTKIKYLYHLKNVTPCPEFTPPEGKRHGRVWMEFNQ